jgi:hypothetical protein
MNEGFGSMVSALWRLFLDPLLATPAPEMFRLVIGVGCEEKKKMDGREAEEAKHLSVTIMDLFQIKVLGVCAATVDVGMKPLG